MSLASTASRGRVSLAGVDAAVTGVAAGGVDAAVVSHGARARAATAAATRPLTASRRTPSRRRGLAATPSPRRDKDAVHAESNLASLSVAPVLEVLGLHLVQVDVPQV